MKLKTRILHSGSYNGHLIAPASKSYLQRALVIAALCPGASVIRGYSPNKDTDTVISAIRNMGAIVHVVNNELRVVGITNFEQDITVHCGESGLAARMFSALSVLFDGKVTITGEGSLMNRSLIMAEKTLISAGKKVQSNHGKLPFIISGSVCSGTFITDASETSQFLTGLLIALSMGENEAKVVAVNPKSIPYVKVTLEILQSCGLSIECHEFEEFVIPKQEKPKHINYTSEGCWSNTAFHLVAAAVSGCVLVEQINTQSTQGDAVIKDVLIDSGAEVRVSKNKIEVIKNKLKPFTFDATHCPDLFPPLAALAANCKGISKIKGVHRLKGKESDRAQAVCEELKKLGISVEIKNDEMMITGNTIRGGIVSSHNDHRIAMALAVIALNATDPIILIDSNAVQKSYPDFFSDFELLKGNVFA